VNFEDRQPLGSRPGVALLIADDDPAGGNVDAGGQRRRRTDGIQRPLSERRFDERAVAPGDTVSLTLYWRALTRMEINYELFVHVLGKENQIWANNQGPITDRATCTNRWETGVVVTEERELTLADETPPGFYDLELGVYAPAGGRLKVLADGGREVSNRILLATIRVTIDE